MRVFLSARFFSPFFFRLSFLEFSCVFSNKEKRGGIDLRRTRADHVCLTKPSECFRSVVSRYHETELSLKTTTQSHCFLWGVFGEFCNLGITCGLAAGRAVIWVALLVSCARSALGRPGLELTRSLLSASRRRSSCCLQSTNDTLCWLKHTCFMLGSSLKGIVNFVCTPATERCLRTPNRGFRSPSSQLLLSLSASIPAPMILAAYYCNTIHYGKKYRFLNNHVLFQCF